MPKVNKLTYDDRDNIDIKTPYHGYNVHIKSRLVKVSLGCRMGMLRRHGEFLQTKVDYTSKRYATRLYSIKHLGTNHYNWLLSHEGANKEIIEQILNPNTDYLAFTVIFIKYGIGIVETLSDDPDSDLILEPLLVNAADKDKIDQINELMRYAYGTAKPREYSIFNHVGAVDF